MTGRFLPGTPVQTPFGKGVVREVRNGGRVLVDVSGRSLVLKETELSAIENGSRPARRVRADPSTAAPPRRDRPVAHEVDLHGLTVEAALARAAEALNDALLADASELRLIHGRSGGRIRAALQEWLRTMPAARGVRTDPRNAGVIVVSL